VEYHVWWQEYQSPHNTVIINDCHVTHAQWNVSSVYPIITSGQSNLTKRPHSHCTWIVQLYSPGCANVTPSNTCFSGPTQVHTPNDISDGSPFLHSSQLWEPVLHNRPPFSPSKLPLIWGSWPHLIHGSLDPLCSHPKKHLDQFSCFCTAHETESLYFTMVCQFPTPSKLPLCMGDLYLHLIHGSLSPHAKWHLNWFSRFSRAYDRDRDRLTDRPRYSVSKNR